MNIIAIESALCLRRLTELFHFYHFDLQITIFCVTSTGFFVQCSLFCWLWIHRLLLNICDDDWKGKRNNNRWNNDHFRLRKSIFYYFTIDSINLWKNLHILIKRKKKLSPPVLWSKQHKRNDIKLDELSHESMPNAICSFTYYYKFLLILGFWNFRFRRRYLLKLLEFSILNELRT